MNFFPWEIDKKVNGPSPGKKSILPLHLIPIPFGQAISDRGHLALRVCSFFSSNSPSPSPQIINGRPLHKVKKLNYQACYFPLCGNPQARQKGGRSTPLFCKDTRLFGVFKSKIPHFLGPRPRFNPPFPQGFDPTARAEITKFSWGACPKTPLVMLRACGAHAHARGRARPPPTFMV